MGLLTSNEIRRLLLEPTTEDERLVVTPMLDLDQQLKDGTASIDVRLGTRFRAARRSNVAYSDPVASPPEYDRDLDDYYVPLGQFFVLHPRHFVLGATLEYLRLPLNTGAYVVGRSTWGRRGLVIATAVGVHPGFAGNLTLELTNLGEIPIRLYPGTSIAQFFFHRLEHGTHGLGDPSAFVGDTVPRPGELREDKVLRRIRSHRADSS